MKRVYLCDHCGGHLGTFTKPSACRKHEAACDYNPANRTCGTCKHQMFDEYFMRRKKRKCAVVGLTMYRQGCEHHESRLSSNAPRQPEPRSGDRLHAGLGSGS